MIIIIEISITCLFIAVAVATIPFIPVAPCSISGITARPIPPPCSNGSVTSRIVGSQSGIRWSSRLRTSGRLLGRGTRPFLFMERREEYRQAQNSASTAVRSDESCIGGPVDDPAYRFVDPSISSVLTASPDEALTSGADVQLIDPKTLCFRWEALGVTLGSSQSSSPPSLQDSLEQEAKNGTDASTDEHKFAPVGHLVSIAAECEASLFLDTGKEGLASSAVSTLPAHLRGLIDLATKQQGATAAAHDSPHTLIATLIALNLLESSIRDCTQRRQGHAPLLKDMIEQLPPHSPSALAPLLRTLLQPKAGGINLRNLLWHGFVASIPRRWFALCIVLTLSIDRFAQWPAHVQTHQDVGSHARPAQLHNDASDTQQHEQQQQQHEHHYHELKSLQSLQSHQAFLPILRHGRNLANSVETSPSPSPSPSHLTNLEDVLLLSTAIPPSHRHLLHVALHEYATHYPLCFAAVAGTIIEHALRFKWCTVNGRMDDLLATQDRYYVTLDGVGQKDRHDIVLLPYVSEGSDTATTTNHHHHGHHGAVGQHDQHGKKKPKKNQLIRTMGGATIALLTDIYASPSGGPNIRASIAHGSYNHYLLIELQHMDNMRSDTKNDGETSSTQSVRVTTTTTVHHQECLNYMAYATLTALHMIALSTMGNHSFLAPSPQLSSSQSSLAELHKRLPNLDHVLETYQPLFSYTSSLTRGIDSVIDALSLLHDTITTEIQLSHMEMSNTDVASSTTKQARLSIALASLQKDMGQLTALQHRILTGTSLHPHPLDNHPSDRSQLTSISTPTSPRWTHEHVFQEHQTNIYASTCGASRTLLDELTTAITSVRDELNRGLCELEPRSSNVRSLSTRRRRQIRRLFGTARLTFDFYSLATFVALVDVYRRVVVVGGCDGKDCEGSLGGLGGNVTMVKGGTVTEAVLSQAVKRSRMVVSTFSTTSNMDRGFKALEEYIAGKSIKLVAKLQVITSIE